ncbi:MAG: DUF483 domain-containing protein [Nanoarchaeota archaeon]
MKLTHNKYNLLDLGNIIAVELFCVLKDIKTVSRFNVGLANLKSFKQFCKKLCLECEENNFNIEISKSYDKKQIDSGVTKISSEKNACFVFVSKNQKNIKEIKEAENLLEKKFNHKKIGELLGYPNCCTDFYIKNRTEAGEKRNDDYTLITLQKSKGFVFPFYLNNALRYFNSAIITFFPCSYSCPKAIDLSKKIFQEIQKASPEFTNFLEDKLKCVVIYTDFDGVHLIRDFDFEKNIIKYKTVESTCKNELNKILCEADELKIVNKNFIKVIKDKKIVKILKKNCGIMMFK